MADFDNIFSTSKAVICLRLSVGLEARSKRKKKKKSCEDVLKKNDSNCKCISKCINTLPVCTASVLDIAFEMSTDGFNSPS